MPPSAAGRVAAALAAAPILLAGAASTATPGLALGGLRSLTVLQWNPHWECFVSQSENTCGINALGALSELLPEKAIDFANVIEINEESDVYQPPYPWMIMTARCSSPDSTALIYNSASWAPVSDAIMGCMEYEDRPFVVQTFRSTATSEKVVVVGAHFPHGDDNGDLGIAVTEVMLANEDALGVVFAADTNREGSTSTASILNGILPSAAMAPTVASSQLYATCCHDDGYVHAYDRIASTFAGGVTTELLFDPAPWWTDIETPWGSEGEFHKALVATFQVIGTEAQVALA